MSSVNAPQASAPISLLLAFLLGACTVLPRSASAPLLHLSPAALGRDLAVVQRLDVQVGGRTRSVDAALEVDADSLRLVMMQVGQTVARLVWDGQHLESRLAPGWPDTLGADQVLNDVQLVWWPVRQIRAALPSGWTVSESAAGRELLHEGTVVTSVTSIDPGHVEVIQHLAGYTLEVHSQGATPEFAAP